MNAALFKYYMIKHHETMATLATVLNKNKVTVSNHIHGNRNSDFSRGDIAKLKSRWNLTNDQIAEIFFNESEGA